ncbi:NADH-quinone oxidoreductase subunit C [Pedobacter antarcticus]|uniref:NADH-quinone oxidoreductase subunit C n=2 Tax=Pedobacter antarcticus TaxID=34086 RepID=A0A081PFQ7_9SPHI|nr:NADH-quinone oxidoreductase subunit C [Pedobacter antarcticus]KEQ29530.1 NADH dehydrogenase [Pedobacter antarcticus 4BY]SDM20416.1 NADH dehydrogenase subunit C [Pedobacter antarcticus]SFF10524.1 NADH dehydrogenase subunit C [Pedobacter antarcticus]
MAEIKNTAITELLSAKFGQQVSRFEEPYGLLTFSATPDVITAVLEFLKNDTATGFSFLTDITAVHYPESNHIAVVYHLHNMRAGIRVRVKVYLHEHTPVIPTATSLWKGANWMERETYDFFGVKFEGHPDLRRILNMDELNVHPMLKQYPLEDPNRVDKKDEYFGR